MRGFYLSYEVGNCHEGDHISGMERHNSLKEVKTRVKQLKELYGSDFYWQVVEGTLIADPTNPFD